MYNFFSDTQTRPSRAMRESILDAEVGDERHDDCPTTRALNNRVAELFGMEAAVFLPSGTMCNEIAIAVHCLPGDEVICERESHVIFAESGGPAALSGVMMHGIDGQRGMMTSEQVTTAIRPNSSFAPQSRLVITEQTANLAGGSVWPLDQLNSVARISKEAGLRCTWMVHGYSMQWLLRAFLRVTTPKITTAHGWVLPRGWAVRWVAY